MRINQGIAATAALGALLLTGCGIVAPDAAGPSPTAVQHADQWENCTVELGPSHSGNNPSEATVDCGEVRYEVTGDFGYNSINRYDPAETGGVRRVIAKGDTTSVYLMRGEGECLIVHETGGDPVECEPTSDKAR